MEWVLMVTWFVGGASASSYTVDFESEELCRKAEVVLVTDQGAFGSRSNLHGLTLSHNCVRRKGPGIIDRLSRRLLSSRYYSNAEPPALLACPRAAPDTR